MFYKNSICIAFVVIMVLLQNSIFAQEKPDKTSNNKERIGLALNLSKDQIASVLKLRFQHQKKMIDLKGDLKKSMIDRQQVLSQGDIDRSKLLSIQSEINDKLGKIKIAATNHFGDVYELLTAEQKEKFTEMVNKRQLKNEKNHSNFNNGKSHFQGQKGKGFVPGRGNGHGRNFAPPPSSNPKHGFIQDNNSENQDNKLFQMNQDYLVINILDEGSFDGLRETESLISD